MNVIIYGKDNCINCNKAKMLCQMKSIEFDYLTVGKDFTVEELQQEVGQPISSLPQIFLAREGNKQYVGGYDDLRVQL